MEAREERIQRLKRLKRKRIITISVLIALVLGLGGGYYGVKQYKEKKAEQEAKKKAEQENSQEIYKLTTFAYNDAAELDVTNEETSYGFYKVDREIGYNWVRKGMDSFPTKATKIMDIIQKFCHMTSTTRIPGEGADLSQYGLDNPVISARIMLKDGSVHQFYLGSETPYSEGHYFLYEGTGDIYVAEPGVYIQLTTPEIKLAQEETFPQTTIENITKVTVSERDGETTSYMPETEADGTVTYPSIFSDCKKFIATEVQEYDCKDFSEYGLDNPYVTVEVDYKESVYDEEGNATEENRTMTAKIGDKAESGGYYVRINESSFVYIMTEAFAKKYIPQ